MRIRRPVTSGRKNSVNLLASSLIRARRRQWRTRTWPGGRATSAARFRPWQRHPPVGVYSFRETGGVTGRMLREGGGRLPIRRQRNACKLSPLGGGTYNHVSRPKRTAVIGPGAKAEGCCWDRLARRHPAHHGRNASCRAGKTYRVVADRLFWYRRPIRFRVAPRFQNQTLQHPYISVLCPSGK